MKPKQKNKAETIGLRNPFALHANQRVSVKFKDRRSERGGAKNLQRDYQEEM